MDQRHPRCRQGGVLSCWLAVGLLTRPLSCPSRQSFNSSNLGSDTLVVGWQHAPNISLWLDDVTIWSASLCSALLHAHSTPLMVCGHRQAR